MLNKIVLVEKVIAILKKENESNQAGLESAQRAAKEAPSAMQSHSDTTRSQMERLADGLKRNIFEKEQAVRALNALKSSINAVANDEVRIGSLVKVSDDSGGRFLYFILPAGGSAKIDGDGEEITVISANAPLAKSLLSRKAGDKTSLTTGPKTRQFQILSIL